MREATIAAILLIECVGHLARQGLATETVCQAARLDPQWLREPHARLPASAMARAWAAGEHLTGDADLGLHSAEQYNPGALSIVGCVILSCSNTGEALGRLARYAPLLSEGLQVSMAEWGGATHCRFGAAEGCDSLLRHSPRQAIETLAARLKGELPSLASIASEMAMSERSVQRSLREEATSFGDIVDAVR